MPGISLFPSTPPPRQIAGVIGCADALCLQTLLACEQPIVVVCETARDCQQLSEHWRSWRGAPKADIFPDYETLAYDRFSPHPDITSARLMLLNQLPHLNRGIVLTHTASIMHRLPPLDYLQTQCWQLKVGNTLSPTRLKEQLVHQGYYAVSEVHAPGEFCQRGSLFDLFAMGCTQPLRIDLFDNEIDSIRLFDPDTQRSLKKIEHFGCLPAHEYPLDEKHINIFRQQWREQFSIDQEQANIYHQVSKQQAIAGLEYYLPLFFNKTNDFFDYLPKNTCLIYYGDITTQAQLLWQEHQTRYEQSMVDTHRPLLPPAQLFLSPQAINAPPTHLTPMSWHSTPANTDANSIALNTQAAPTVTVMPEQAQPLASLLQTVNNHPGRCFIGIASSGRLEIIKQLLTDAKQAVTVVADWRGFAESDQPLCIGLAHLSAGLVLNNPAWLILTEQELFGQRSTLTRRNAKHSPSLSKAIQDLGELQIDDAIVHRVHGIGFFKGLQTIETDEQINDYIVIHYADNAKVYVPIHQMHLLSRYIGADKDHITAHSLGNKKWQRERQQAKEKIYDIAHELLKTQATRELATSIACTPPDESYHRFVAQFPFDETPDQQRAIDDVIDDLCATRKMDRLICGDVGFGKTEVAMRAAFIAVLSHQQVAILAPTTLLAQQHLESFRNRFSDWPIHIAGLSRLESTKSTQDTLKKLADGTIDIVIGTHKLLQASVQFKQLGLLIIDEEHRFGVRQKERIKMLSHRIDLLAMTATPIPRTLNMALSGRYDISMITTPPEKRLAIKTMCIEYENYRIREAILREIQRGGQVYFCHNEVNTIADQTERLRKLIPEANIQYAHGQMHKKDLESIIADFYHQRFNVLVSTTIIESGIDVPCANTMLINRAHRYGLAQLHQLRGRVGRSHHQAYAYLIIPDKQGISREATKRLEAITQLSDLGAGFDLANADLDIRGAGDLLGEAQSGHLTKIGYALYLELLNEAMAILKQTDASPNTELAPASEITLPISTIIPEDWIHDVGTRLTLYQQLGACHCLAALQTLKIAWIDRFGSLPDKTQQLLAHQTLQITANGYGIAKIQVGSTYATITLSEKHRLDAQKLLTAIQSPKATCQLINPQCFRLTLASPLKTADDIMQLTDRISQYFSTDSLEN